jgi:glycolate oxidase iron-sulfur subunit
MLDLVPSALPPAQRLPAVAPAHGERRARVALLAGCAQRVLDPDINTATIEVLTRHGVEVVVPAAQGCCGGLAWHTGDLRAAQAFARRNLDAFPADVDAILTNAAGCGSAMHEYHLVLRGTSDEARAEAFRKRVLDVSVFLARLGLRELPTSTRAPQKIAYHDACHLAHAQGVHREPRELLRSIPGVVLCELANAHICCGSAGTYNLDQPEIAASLGEKKARAVIATGAEVVASGNIGCLTQLRAHLAKLGSPIQVRHTMQVLRDAYPSDRLSMTSEVEALAFGSARSLLPLSRAIAMCKPSPASIGVRLPKRQRAAALHNLAAAPCGFGKLWRRCYRPTWTAHRASNLSLQSSRGERATGLISPNRRPSEAQIWQKVS